MRSDSQLFGFRFVDIKGILCAPFFHWHADMLTIAKHRFIVLLDESAIRLGTPFHMYWVRSIDIEDNLSMRCQSLVFEGKKFNRLGSYVDRLHLDGAIKCPKYRIGIVKNDTMRSIINNGLPQEIFYDTHKV